MIKKPSVKKNSSEINSRIKARAQALRLLYLVEQRGVDIGQLIADELVLIENVNAEICECTYMESCQPRAYFDRFGEAPSDYECPHRELAPSMQKTTCPTAYSCECKRYFADSKVCPEPGVPFKDSKGADPCYCVKFKKCSYREFYEDCSSMPLDYAMGILEGVAENRASIDTILAEVSVNWSVSRMPLIDKNILRMATWEILFYKEVPVSVSINEAVSLAKEYGTEDSHKFVNGLLGKIASQGEELLNSLGANRYE